MTQSRDIRAVFGYIVDDASVKKAIAASTALTGTLKDAQLASVAATASDVVAKEAAAKGTTAVTIAQVQLNAALEQSARSQAFTKLAADAASGAVSIDALTLRLAALGATDLEIKQLVADMERLNAAQSGGGGIAGSLSKVRQGLIALPGIGFQSPIVFAVRGAELAATQLGLGVAALGALGVAAAAVVVILKLFTDESDRVYKATKARLEVEEQVRKAVEDATRLEAEAQRNQAERDKKRAQDRLAELQSASVPVAAGTSVPFAIADSILGNITHGLVGNSALKAYNEDIDAQKLAIVAADTAIEAWNAALAAHGTLVGDQIALAHKALEVDQLTHAEIGERLAQDNRQVSILREAANAAGVGSDAYKILQVEIEGLTDDIDELVHVGVTYADLLEREKNAKEALSDAGQDVLDAIKREVEAREALYEIEQRTVDVITEANSKLQDALDDANLKRANAEADAEDRRNEIIAGAAEQRQEIDQQDAERRAEILKRFNTDYGNAVAERDALGALKAKQQRDDDLAKQDKAHDKQIEALQKSLDKQLAAVQKSLDKQLRSIQDNYDRQTREIGQALAKQLEALRREKAQEQANLENAIQARIVLERNYQQLTEQANRTHYDALLAEANQGMGNIAANFRNWFGYIAGLVPQTGGGVGSVIVGGAYNAPISFPSLNNGSLPTAITGGAPGRGTLPGAARRSNSGTFAPIITINAAQMTPAQLDRRITSVVVGAARKAGFRG